ncbi:MAG TPA: hypothetical protein VK886_03810 [Vicinamibacterales bacterium]|nr:hypothetical protein [Vicinamibacterales bacterium]
MRALLTAFVLASFLVACGGGGGSGNGNGGTSPSPSPGQPGQNPCATAALEAEFGDEPLGARADDDGLARDKTRLDGSHRWRVLDDLYAHRAARLRGAVAAPPPNNADVGEIAVVQDQGDLILRANAFDLKSVGLTFVSNGSGGYDVRKSEGAFRSPLGTRLTLSDDDSRPATVPFAFPFFGRTLTAAFVNSDGNVTFNEEDKASTDRSVSRLLTGPPRVAPFFADLDPSVGGSVWLNATSTAFTVTWCGVRGFESPRIATVQTTLLPDGTVEVKIADETSLGEAIVAVSPGTTGEFKPIDLSAQGPTSGGGGALGERFAESGQLDTVALGRKFFQTHADIYDQLVIFTDTRFLTTSFAYESTVKNEIRGIGIDVYDIADEFGSGGTLRSVVVMDALTKYPDDPAQKFQRENSTLSLLGQETGHRWLAFLEFRDANGQRSTSLLGRDQAHWSFFMDSDASVMEGNDIEELGGGAFRTREAVARFSLLDQYAMGLVRESEVPPFFYVEGATNTTRVAESPPAVGIQFNGTRRTVLMQDVVAAMGRRVPSAEASPRLHRQAFVYVVTTGAADASQIAKLDRFRRAWEPFFAAATDGRMRLETSLE